MVTIAPDEKALKSILPAAQYTHNLSVFVLSDKDQRGLKGARDLFLVR